MVNYRRKNSKSIWYVFDTAFKKAPFDFYAHSSSAQVGDIKPKLRNKVNNNFSTFL
jgi:hypothetical protein